MTKMEDLPLVERQEISTTWPVKRHLWEQRAVLALRNAKAARELAYATVGANAPEPRYTLSADPISVEYVDVVTDVPDDMFGIKYTWKVESVHAR